jgi:hypothetical protein
LHFAIDILILQQQSGCPTPNPAGDLSGDELSCFSSGPEPGEDDDLQGAAFRASEMVAETSESTAFSAIRFTFPRF